MLLRIRNLPSIGMCPLEHFGDGQLVLLLRSLFFLLMMTSHPNRQVKINSLKTPRNVAKITDGKPPTPMITSCMEKKLRCHLFFSSIQMSDQV